MARVSKVETCLICDQVPCECSAGSKKKTPAKPRRIDGQGGEALKVERQRDEASPVPRPGSARDRMKAAAAAAPKPKPGTVRTSPTEARVKPPQPPPSPDPNLVFASALRNLAPILHSEELERYKMILGAAPTMTERAAAWRARVQGDP